VGKKIPGSFSRGRGKILLTGRRGKKNHKGGGKHFQDKRKKKATRGGGYYRCGRSLRHEHSKRDIGRGKNASEGGILGKTGDFSSEGASTMQKEKKKELQSQFFGPDSRYKFCVGNLPKKEEGRVEHRLEEKKIR